MNRILSTRIRRSLLEAMIATIVLTCTVPCAFAQIETWNGGTGNWNVGANWTPTGVPNGSTIDVVINGTSGNQSSVTLNIEPNSMPVVVRNLSLDSFSTLTMADITFNVAGSTISNAGQINIGVGTPGNYANFFLVNSTVNLSGGGIVNLSNASSQLGSTGGNTLVNVDNTIQGQHHRPVELHQPGHRQCQRLGRDVVHQCACPKSEHEHGDAPSHRGRHTELLQRDRHQYRRDHFH